MKRPNSTKSGKHHVKIWFRLQTEKEGNYQTNSYSKLSTKTLNKWAKCIQSYIWKQLLVDFAKIHMEASVPESLF